MFLENRKLFFLLVFIALNTNMCASKEHVPVFMWATKTTFHQGPALHRISEESFKHKLSEKLESNPLIVVFAERTLSPEDFAHHDTKGITPFENLHDFLKTSSVDYLPYVQNPIGATKELGKEVTEVPLASLLHNSEVPNGEVLIVDLNDAKDNEPRIQMLKRHDSAIADIFSELLQKNDNIIAVYTSHHKSWLVPDVVKHRNVRSLLQSQNETAENSETQEASPAELTKGDEGLIGDNKNLLLYVSSTPLISHDNGKTFSAVPLEVTNCEKKDNVITFQLSGKDVNLNFEIILQSDGYWVLKNVSSSSESYTFPEITAPIGFSYHCFNVSFKAGSEILILPGLQIEPFSTEEDHPNFNDAYDCVGFTSIPIWTGIFVTVIMLLILTFGITFMMDIKTMDKFDDAKGKTITINASE
ncbi:V-type proton ATPase subunit S1 [Coccinella septempunctata]|uniref:V-type proton ATPase subunit S1 n=1 Tax=Coccinella septempunctata TaxID=41139 RepID=UPI001D08658E|nr:V-type proton ATPase subunit S1 [Coccinella septempunctata]